MEIAITCESESFLEDIITLWRKHSKTLGFFPDGAFQDHSYKKQIIVAHSNDNEVAGYLLFRSSRFRTTIVHLCINTKHKSKGISKLLVGKLRQIAAESMCISLKCRRDYNLQGFWSSLGFVAKNEVKGRGKDQSILTCWRMDTGAPDLFTAGVRDNLRDKICIVIDANVFYGLYSDEKEDDETKSLVADWFPETLELCITDEILNEIDRQSDAGLRQINRERSQTFTTLPYDVDTELAVEDGLKNIIGVPQTASRKSDLRQISKAIAANALYFITRDNGLLKHTEAIYDKYQMTVLRPYEMIITLDQIEREHDYQPARLTGTQHKVRLIDTGELPSIVETFVNTKKGERARDLKEIIANELSRPRESTSSVLASPIGQTHALLVYTFTRSKCDVKVFRIKGSPLSSTIGRHLLRRLSIFANKKSVPFIFISDNYMDDTLISALGEDGFIQIERGWLKVSLPGIFELETLYTYLEKLESEYTVFSSGITKLLGFIRTAIKSQKHTDIAALERMLWPACIVGYDLPTYIIPIKPQWAKHLFDEHMAMQDLFGASDLIFNKESVYYRSGRQVGIEAPGRIVWYASWKSGYPEAGSLRGISSLDEVHIGLPKKMYARFRRLGVYSWKDVLQTAKNDINKELMAIKFSGTYNFAKPIEYTTLQGILQEFKLHTTIPGPYKIKEDILCRIINSAGYTVRKND